MHRLLLIPLLLLLCATAAFAEPPNPDGLAKHAIDVLAGPEWAKARYVSYTFDLERNGTRAASFPQRWDRVTGDYRVGGRDAVGREFIVLMNVNTKKGRAFANGAEVSGKELEDFLALGLRRYNNDTYWLLMPLKMSDPGAKHTYEGERKENGHVYDVVKTTLEGGDQYWAWINRESGSVEQWQMKPQGMKPEDPPVAILFHDFKRVGGLLISTRREVVGKGQMVLIDDLVIAPETPKDAFAAPAAKP
jgi:hypothetical protein